VKGLLRLCSDGLLALVLGKAGLGGRLLAGIRAGASPIFWESPCVLWVDLM